jgi:hypothetical protein
MVLRGLCVSSGAVCLMVAACDDGRPPEVEVEPAAWIHDPTRVGFSERVTSASWARPELHVVVDGRRVGVEVSVAPSPADRAGQLFHVRLPRGLVHSGSLRLEFGDIVDGDGHRLDAEPADWTVDSWADEVVPAWPGAPSGPVTLVGGLTTGRSYEPAYPVIAAMWSAYGALQVVVRKGESWWSHEAEIFGLGDPVAATGTGYWAIAAPCGDRETCLVAMRLGSGFWPEGWGRLPVETPVGIAASDTVVVVGVSLAYGLQVARLVGGEPESLPRIPITRLLGRPAVGVTHTELPIVALFDQVAADQVELQIHAFDGAAWVPWAAAPVEAADAELRLAVRGNDAYVAWHDGGLHVGAASPAGITPISAPTLSPEARVGAAVVSDEGDLVLTWTEGDTLHLARYRGFAWERIADPLPGAGDPSSLALWDDRAPVVAWSEDDRIRVGLPNGPSR